MSNLAVCFGAILPIFILMALGCLARRLGAVSRDDVPKLNGLMFKYFMPVMLFYNIITSDFSTAVQPKLLIFAEAGVLIEYGICVAYVLLTEKVPNRRGVMIQGLSRSNFVIIGLPLATALVSGESAGPVAVLIAVVVPTFNVLAVITLEAFSGTKPKVGRLLRDIIKNPLILGTAAGLIWVGTGLEMPAALMSAIKQIASVATPMMLFLLGAFFRWGSISEYLGRVVQVVLGRLVILPGIFLTAAYLLGIRGIGFAGMIAAFGSATAIASFTMTQQMGGDAELAGDIVVATSALCCFTMFGWSLLFKSLGAF